MKTASQEFAEINLRRVRAQQLAAAVIDEIRFSSIECDLRQMNDLLVEVFARNGANIMTDEDRDKAGLEPRDGLGWTPSERLAQHKAKMDAMTMLASGVVHIKEK